MSKNIVLGVAIFIIMSGVAGFASADTEEFLEAKNLINQGKACQQLNSDELEKIGDYYMEQMMPGQAHKNMDQILSGEGSESLKQMHILMARRWYCGDAIGMGMMGMMSGFGFSGMMGRNSGSLEEYGDNQGMMGRLFGQSWNGGYGMMSAYSWVGGLVMLLSVVLLVTGIAAAIKYLLKK